MARDMKALSYSLLLISINPILLNTETAVSRKPVLDLEDLCGDGFTEDPAEGFCYKKMTEEPLSWAEAFKSCQKMGVR